MPVPVRLSGYYIITPYIDKYLVVKYYQNRASRLKITSKQTDRQKLFKLHFRHKCRADNRVSTKKAQYFDITDFLNFIYLYRQ